MILCRTLCCIFDTSVIQILVESQRFGKWRFRNNNQRQQQQQASTLLVRAVPLSDKARERHTRSTHSHKNHDKGDEKSDGKKKKTKNFSSRKFPTGKDWSFSAKGLFSIVRPRQDSYQNGGILFYDMYDKSHYLSNLHRNVTLFGYARIGCSFMLLNGLIITVFESSVNVYRHRTPLRTRYCTT